MLSTLATAYAAYAATELLAAVIITAHAQSPVIEERAAAPSPSLALNAMTPVGCFSSSQPLSDQGSYTYQTSGYCQPICVGLGQAVMGLAGGSDCWCGDQIPAAASKVDDSLCSAPCHGYNKEMCGGNGFWTVYLSGTTNDVSNYGGNSAASSSLASSSSPSPPASSTSAAPSVVTSITPGQTIVVTQSASPSPSSGASTDTAVGSQQHSSSGPNVAGIAAGVVVGVLALAALAAGAFFLMRHRRRKSAESEYSRSNQVSEFMGKGRPPQTAQSNISDSRLDPEAMMGRRTSIGSIADNQDYSRRILRVANPT